MDCAYRLLMALGDAEIDPAAAPAAVSVADQGRNKRTVGEKGHRYTLLIGLYCVE
ncbi:MAG: hypothetical protein TU35_001050 [Thermoproteus sp. AZ2]|jgi:hypothetical protein|uniref:Uncharacterized protein n=1 Tax=Thermoproteus sp. AZ2 TaxID=1609232 RepID=A0ACC6UYL8_9CREN